MCEHDCAFVGLWNCACVCFYFLGGGIVLVNVLEFMLGTEVVLLFVFGIILLSALVLFVCLRCL